MQRKWVNLILLSSAQERAPAIAKLALATALTGSLVLHASEVSLYSITHRQYGLSTTQKLFLPLLSSPHTLPFSLSTATCPNSCSGNGICFSVADIAKGARNPQLIQSSYGENIYTGMTSALDYKLWDSDKNQACVCDPGYSGIDCSLRLCPRGDDPLTTLPYTCGLSPCRNELQSFSVDGGQTGGVYSLVFTDLDGTSYTTDDFLLSTDSTKANWATIQVANEEAISSALMNLPNMVTGTVSVTTAVASSSAVGYDSFPDSAGGSSAKYQLRFTVEFTTKSGDLPSMQLQYNRVANPATGASFLFGPGQPVQTFTFAPITSAPFTEFVQFKIFPMDPTLFSLDDYWTSDVIDMGLILTGTTFAISTAIANALNSIPAIMLAYSAPFVPDGTVITYVDSVIGSGKATVKIVFPDSNTGFNAIQYKRGYASASQPPTLDSVSWSTVPITDQDNVDGNKEAAVCANRGLCDYGTGLCSCFAGHTGVDCSHQSALARGFVSSSGTFSK
jgi:hypothetical protein